MKQFSSVFKHFDGNLVLHGFDTEHDLKLAEKALERMLTALATMSMYTVNKELEPYRRKCAKELDKELAREEIERETDKK